MDGNPGRIGSESRRWDNQGYTLVEVLVAVAILSIGLMGVMSAISVSQDTQDRAMNIAAARDIAISRLETYRNLSPDQLGTIPASDTSTDLPPGNTIACSAVTYGGAGSSIYRATVTVSWPEGGSTRTINYESLLYKP